MRARLRTRLADIDGVLESESAFKDTLAYWVNGKEIAHFEGDDDAVDIRLTRAEIRRRRAELRADPRVRLRPNTSDWLTVEIHEPADESFAVELVEIAAAAHRAAAQEIGAPPPSGAELERRRRFH